MGIFTDFSRLLWIASPLFAVVLSHRLRTLAMTYHTNHCSHPVIASEAKQSSKIQKNRAFTLAEIMIVLSVIGILTAILLPAARQITPDENVIKFKKGHNTLYSVIRELVTSDKYCLDGDLGVKPNGDRVNSATYFCETFADILNAKKISCSKEKTDRYYGHFNAAWSDASKEKYSLDTACKKYATTVGAEIITIDDVVFYSVNPFLHFNASFSDAYDGAVAEPETRMYYQVIDVIESNAQGLLENSYEVYKSFCMDVDGINKGEDPFGYGIRVDGKILNGTRATEWLNKSIQGDD